MQNHLNAQEYLRSSSYSSTFAFWWKQIKFLDLFNNRWRLHALGKERLRHWRKLPHFEAVRANERACCSWKHLENEEPDSSWCAQRLKDRLEQEKFHFDVRNISQRWYWNPQKGLPRETAIPTPLKYWMKISQMRVTIIVPAFHREVNGVTRILS